MQSVERRDPGAVLSGALSLTVHVLLFAVLFFGIRWKTKQPDPVMAELWSALPPVEAPRVVPPKPPPVVEPKPEPKPEPRPEPKVEAKPQPKPDIALEEERKRKEERERKQKEEQELKQREELRAKEEKERKAREEAAEKKRQEEEKRRLEAENRERIQEQLNRELAAAPKTGTPTVTGDPRAMDEWRTRIIAKVRPNIVIPPGIVGNPEAVFDVQLLPTGEVLSAKARKSSGVKAYDDAVERAIYKSSPFPLPPQREVFQRDLRLTFRPLD